MTLRRNLLGVGAVLGLIGVQIISGYGARVDQGELLSLMGEGQGGVVNYASAYDGGRHPGAQGDGDGGVPVLVAGEGQGGVVQPA